MSTQVKENVASVIEAYQKTFASKLSQEQLEANTELIKSSASNTILDAGLAITAGNTDNVRIDINGSTAYFNGSVFISAPTKLDSTGTIVPASSTLDPLFEFTTSFSYDQGSHFLVFFHSNDGSYLGYFSSNSPIQDSVNPSTGAGNGHWNS